MSTSLATGALPAPTPYTFGTMSMGGNPAAMPAHIALVHQAMELGLWFHTSQEYAGGGTFQVLRRAFAERRTRPPIIAKIRCDDAAILRFDVEDLLRRLDVERIEIAQLCKAKHDRREVVDDLLNDGPMAATCAELRQRGLVGAFSLELFTPCSADGGRAIDAGLFDLYSFYWNAAERELSADAYARLCRSPALVLAMRPIAGGLNTPADVERKAKNSYVAQSIPGFQAAWPLVAEAGCRDLVELSLRYLAGTGKVLTVIGGTATPAHLVHYAETARSARPLPPALHARIEALHQAK